MLSNKRMVVAIILGVIALFLIVFGLMRYAEYREAIRYNEKESEYYTWNSMIKPKEYATKIYNGQTYSYRPGIINLLLLGIDTQGELKEHEVSWASGQCDAIYVISLDKINSKTTIVQISRDTMTEINLVGINGDPAGVKKAQIALSYAYGNGKDTSCNNAKAAVSNLLGGIPIDYVASMNISAIKPLVDVLGGVTVTCPRDLTSINPAWTEGTIVTLDGENAEHFVRDRMTVEDGTNELRMSRQRVFVDALLQTLTSKANGDVTDVTTWYDAIQPYTYFKDSLEDYLGLFQMASEFNGKETFTPKGTTEYHQFAEFYIDQDDLTQIVLNTWYKK